MHYLFIGAHDQLSGSKSVSLLIWLYNGIIQSCFINLELHLDKQLLMLI